MRNFIYLVSSQFKPRGVLLDWFETLELANQRLEKLAVMPHIIPESIKVIEVPFHRDKKTMLESLNQYCHESYDLPAIGDE